MDGYSTNDILKQIEKLPNEEAMELLSNFTNLNLMQILNLEDTFEACMKEVITKQLKLSRTLTSLYQVYASLRGIDNSFIVQDTLSDVRKMSKDLEFLLDKYDFKNEEILSKKQVIPNE